MNVLLLHSKHRHAPATHGHRKGGENKNTITINVSKSNHS